MEAFELKPYENVGIVKFNSERVEVRKSLGNFSEFRKTKFSKNTTDDFRFLHVIYDENNKVEAIEFFKESKLVLNGKNLFDFSYEELKSYLNDSNSKEDDFSYTSNKFGLTFSKGDDGKVESILAFRKGYWD